MSAERTTLSRISTSALRAVFFTAAAMLAVTQLLAQNTTTYTEYAAKFVCGIPTGFLLAHDTVGNAEYTTSINIHNPNLFSTNAPISFLKKAVLVKTEGDPLIPPSAFRQDSLANDYGEDVDCFIIRELLHAAAAPVFIEGFLVIVVPPGSSPNQLDVVGVYTASNNTATSLQPTSLEIVPIAPRIIAPPPTGGALDGKLQ